MSSGSREANALHHRWYTDRWAQRRSSSTGSGGVEPSRYILAAMMAGGVDALEQFRERSAWEDYSTATAAFVASSRSLPTASATKPRADMAPASA
jgi:hypothetical protein